MGHSKVRPLYIEPYYSPYYYQLIGFQTSPDIDITPLVTEIERKTEVGKEEAIARLRNAIMAAIGSLTYNPYERLVSESFAKRAETQVSPFRGTETIAPTLRTAGAYVALPAPIEPKSAETTIPTFEGVEPAKPAPTHYAEEKEQYETYLPTYQKAFESAKQFLESTRQNLLTMGFSAGEIREMMSPYLSAIKEGITSSLGMGGVIRPEYQEFVTEWGLV